MFIFWLVSDISTIFKKWRIKMTGPTFQISIPSLLFRTQTLPWDLFKPYTVIYVLITVLYKGVCRLNKVEIPERLWFIVDERIQRQGDGNLECFYHVWPTHPPTNSALRKYPENTTFANALRSILVRKWTYTLKSSRCFKPVTMLRCSIWNGLPDVHLLRQLEGIIKMGGRPCRPRTVIKRV